MNLAQRIEAFSALGSIVKTMSEEEKKALFRRAENENAWFTPDFCELALSGICLWLEKENLGKWLNSYPQENFLPINVGIIPAGNIPLVGFHDVLCALITGNKITLKPSSKDSVLIKFLLNELCQIAPELSEKIVLTESVVKNCDAYIATGSNNTSLHFEQYFGKYPHIIRKNRTSLAVLTGKESSEDLKNLAKDIFIYYGLGCRNVSKLFFPRNFDPVRIMDSWKDFEFLGQNHRWVNNYDYIRSIYLINKTPFLDNGTACLKEDTGLFSPQTVVYYEFYEQKEEVFEKINAVSEQLQCLVGDVSLGKQFVPFGNAQFPAPHEYADGADTIAFLLKNAELLR
jgi:hypothetical protein